MSRFIILAAMAIVVGLPFALRKQGEVVSKPDVTLVIITPHNESIRYEFGRAFRLWYKEKHGKEVAIDWRVPGGTSEIVRYVNSEFLNAFRNHWERKLGKPWSSEVAAAFDNKSVVPDNSPEDDTPAEAARRAFLDPDSKISAGLDIFFGGGSYDFNKQAAAGRIVASGLVEQYLERFNENILPMTFQGETFRDPKGRWIGCALSTFGMLYNKDLVREMGIETPRRWEDLANPAFLGQIGVSDPTKSGSMTKAFEMIVQQQMQERVREIEAKGKPLDKITLQAAIEAGWMDGMQLIQKISANARYFTDSATKAVIDVAQGNCAAGMCIDFYGRYQEQIIAERNNGVSRVRYLTPENGSTLSADTIALFRGAPNAEVAKAFLDFVTRVEGQKIWDFRAGTPGGPVQYTLRRPPARKDLYTAEHRQYLADADLDPYEQAGDFVYNGKWTGPLFSPLRFIIRTAFIDAHHELVGAWRAIILAREEGRPEDAQRAEAYLQDLSKLSYQQALEEIRPVLKGKKIEQVRLARSLSEHFRQRYLEAAAIARGQGSNITTAKAD